MNARPLAILLSVIALLGGTVGGAAAAAPLAGPTKDADASLLPHVPGTLLVGFEPGSSRSERAAARSAVGALSAAPLSPLATDAEKWRLPASTTLTRAMEALSRNPNVRFAEPDWLVQKQDTSNDPYYTNGSLWGMHGDGIASGSNQYGTGADEAWAMGATGSNGVYVGVIDEGAQWDHVDLVDNYWTNPYENPTDGIDNDGNGYIDDVHGWDFFYNDKTTYDAGEDNHGTHVSGTIGGKGGNGLGVAGVNWNVTMISGKFLGPGGGSTSGAILAVDYMTGLKTRHGLNIVATSNSWGGGGFSQALLDAINRGGDQGILFIAAAGNASANTDSGSYYPQGYQCTNGGTRGWDCVMSIASIDSAGNLSSFSNYGAVTVDLGAPGSGIYSSLPTNSYGSYSGTSMATPHVSGAAALCASMAPGLSAREIRNALVSTTRATASLAGRTVSGGRLDVGALITSGACGYATVPPSGSVADLAATAAGTSTVSLTWSDTISDESSYEIERAPGTAPGACGTFTSAGMTGPNATGFLVGGLAAGTSYCFRVRGANSYTEGTNRTAWSNLASATTNAPPPPYVCSTVGFGWLDPAGGTSWTFSDDSAVGVALPFAVTSYGTTYTSVGISSNGFLRLGSTSGATTYSNVAIPNTGEPNAIFAPAWDDWNPGAGGTISAKVWGSAPNRRYVVTWSDIPHFSVTGSAVSFQAILEEGTDAVTFQYLDMATGNASYDRGATATAGVESATGEFGTQLSYNAGNLADSLAKRCSATPGVPATVTVPASYPDATTGVAYTSAPSSATGGVGPYAWSLASGSLPAGLAVDASTGAIAGTPTSTGSFTFVLRATGGDGGIGLGASRTIRSSAPLAIVQTGALVGGSVGTGYSSQLTATGGFTPLAWTLAPGSDLPDGLALSGTGLVSGTPTTDGTTTFTVVATDAAQPVARVASATLSITVVLPLVVTTATYPDATTGVGYAVQLAVANAAGPVSWTVSGSLPAGVTLNGSSGLLSGIPTTAGTYSFTITATATGAAGSRGGSIRVSAPLGIVQTGALPGATPGSTYSTTLTTTGGLGTVSWSLGSALPAGLVLNGATGVISGNPTESGTFTVTVTATDTAQPVARTDTHNLTLSVAFVKVAPANNVRFARTTSSVTISWPTYKGATGYQYCLTTSSKGCTTWTSTSSTSIPQAVSANQTWYWNVRAVLPDSSTVTTPGGLWKFSIAK